MPLEIDTETCDQSVSTQMSTSIHESPLFAEEYTDSKIIKASVLK